MQIQNSAILYLIELKIIRMQIALRKITRNFHQAFNQVIKVKRIPIKSFVLGNQKQNKTHGGLFRKVGFEFVSIALPFKTTKPRLAVQEFLNAHQLQYQDSPTAYKVKICPFCVKPHNNDRTNLYALNIHKEHGHFHCFRCSSKGTWLQFRERVFGFTQEMFEKIDQIQDSFPVSGGNVNRDSKMSDAEFFFYRSNLQKEEYNGVVQYLYSRGFNDKTIADYNIGAGVEEFIDADGKKFQVKCIYFPSYKVLEEDEQKQLMFNQFKHQSSNCHYNNNWSEIVKVKVRGSGKQNKRYMRQLPAGGQKGFFGLNLVKDSDNTIVITEGQFDAMAVYQQTGMPALSLPQGATSLPDVLLPYLSRFEKIVLWMDNDEAGTINTGRILQKLGVNRTAVVKHLFKQKDANQFLQKNPERISELIFKARTIPDSSLLSFTHLRDAIFTRISKTEENNGIKISWLPFFNKVVKGLRMGQLTIMSGPTGSGKTTFLTQLTLDLCKKDICVLWGSFQIRNQILITSMLYQFADLRLDKHLEKYDYFADKFSKLPLHFMDFYGSHSIDKILSTIVYCIQKQNAHVIVIDTLQFLLSEQGEGFKKFELQDTLMAKLRDISIKYNVHVMIVIHPRKTDDGQDIGIHSIYGTSKATQEADNIWVIQNRQNFKIFDVKKNRYDGQLSRIPLGFNRNSKNFFQLAKEEFQALRLKEKTMSDIVHAREQQKESKTDAYIDYEDLLGDEIVDSDMNRQRKTTFKPQQAKNE